MSYLDLATRSGHVVAIAAGSWMLLYVFYRWAREGFDAMELVPAFMCFIYPFQGDRKWQLNIALLVIFVPLVLIAAKLDEPSGLSFAADAWMMAFIATALSASCTLFYGDLDADWSVREQERTDLSSSLELHGQTRSGHVVSYKDSGMRFGGTCGFTLEIDVGGTTVSAMCESHENEIANWLDREVEVHYDTSNPANAVLLSTSPGSLVGNGTVPRAKDEPTAKERLARQQALLDELADTGTGAKAVVTNYDSTNILLNEDGLLAVLEVTVLPEEGSTFTSTFDAALSYAGLSKYQIGQMIWVRFDPLDTSRVSIDFEKQRGIVSTSD